MCQAGPELRRSRGRLRTGSAKAGGSGGACFSTGAAAPSELVSGNPLPMCLMSCKQGRQRCRDKLDPGPAVHLSVPPPAQPPLAERRLRKVGSIVVGNCMFCAWGFR